MNKKIWAIVLAGGQGKRMNSSVHKQYLLIHDRPVLYYTLHAFENSRADGIVLVCGSGEIDYCREKIVDRYGFKKVLKIVEGGAERYHSVYNGLKAIEEASCVLIHDGARPFVTEDIIDRNIECVKEYGACVTAMPSKDTIKIADECGFVADTPDRSRTWIVQTPQTFEFALIKKAYEKLLSENMMGITDDAMVVEQALGYPIKFVEGSYTNIKITTPEDLKIAQILV